MSDPWAEFTEVKPQSGGPKPIISLADPMDGLDRTSKEVGISTSLSGEDRAERKDARDVDDRQFDEMAKLRDAFGKLPEVVEYRTAIRAYASALQTAPNSAGDQTLITSYAKMLDPNSVVREGEFNTVAAGDSRANQILAQIQKEGGFGEGGMLRPEYRAKMRREMHNMVTRYNEAYNLQRKDYSNFAQQAGYEPDQVLGTHAGAPFKETIQEYLDSVNPKKPEMRGGVPIGTEVTFEDQDGFNREKWLQESYGITPNQEATIMAFYNENRGNQNLTAQQVQEFYESIGAGMPDISEEYLQTVRDGKVNFGPMDSSAVEAEYAAKRAEIAAERDNFGGEVDAGFRGAADILTLGLADKAAAIGDTVVSGGTYADNLENQRMITQADVDVNPIGRTTGQIAGGVMMPFGAGARSAAELAKVGAISGAAYNFNTSEGDLGERVLDAVTGGITGAAGGAAIGKVAPIAGNAIRNVASRVPAKSNEAAREFVQAAGEEGLDYMLADVPGKTAAKYATGLSGVTLGGIPIRDAATKIVTKAGEARDRIAGKLSSVGDDASAGQAVRRGVEKWEKEAGGRATNLYEEVSIPNEAQSQISNTQQALAEINEGLSSNEELSEIIKDSGLARIQSAFTRKVSKEDTGLLDASGKPMTREVVKGGELSWQDLKKFRTFIGEKAGRPTFQNDTSKKSLDRLYGALSEDMQATAAATSQKALQQFQRANTYYRAVQGRKEAVMKRLVGNNLDMSSEGTFKQMQSWAKTKGGDYAKFSQAVRSLPEDEANAVRANFVDRLGNDKAGMSSADSENFSPAKFLTHWKDLSGRSKAVLFKGEDRKSLDNLATVFEGMGDASAFTNNSKTGISVAGGATGALAWSNPIVGALAAGGQYLTGKLLSSPAVAKWLTAGLKKPNAPAQLAHINKLTSIAKANPAIAEDVFQLQGRLAEAFAATPQRAAAEDAQSSETTKTIPVPQ